jgi:hypothetical protein
MKKRIISVFVCLVMVLINIVGVTPQARALVGVDDAMMIGLMGKLLISCGVSFSSYDVAQRTSQDFYNDAYITDSALFDSVIDDAEIYYPAKNTSHEHHEFEMPETYYDINSPRLKLKVGQLLFEFARDWVAEHFDEGENIIPESPESVLIDTYYPFLSEVITTVSGSTEVYHWFMDGASIMRSSYDASGDYINTITMKTISSQYSEYPKYFKWSSNEYFSVWTYDGEEYVLQYITPANTCSYIIEARDSGIFGAAGVIDNDLWDWSNTWTDDKTVDIPLIPGVETGVAVNDDLYGLDHTILAREVVGTDYQDIIDADVTGIPYVPAAEAEADATEAITDSEAATEAEAYDETGTSLKGIIFTKFPFCLPWDLAQAIKLIASPAQAPYFECDPLESLPFEFNGDTTIIFDFNEFPMVGQVCRWTMTVGFCIALILVTSKIIKW